MRIIIEKHFSKNDLTHYLRACKNDKIEFYNMAAHESHLDYTYGGFSDNNSKFKKQILKGFYNLRKDNKNEWLHIKKFTIESFKFVPTHYGEKLVINQNSDESVYFENICRVTINGKEYYTCIMNMHHMDSPSITIPVSIFDALEFNENDKTNEFSITEKIDCLSNYDKECVEKILNLFNIDINDCDDEVFYSHKNAKLIKQFLEPYNLLE